MPKPNLAELPTRPLRKETRTLTDELQPGTEFVFTLKGGDLAATEAYVKLRDSYVVNYVTGTADKKVLPSLYPVNAGATPPEPPEQLSETACYEYAGILSLQAPEDPADAYTLEELILLRRRAPGAFKELKNWSWDLFDQPYVKPEAPAEADPANPTLAVSES